MFSTAKEIFDDLTSKRDADQIQSLFVPYLLSVLIERENEIKTQYTQIQNMIPVFASARMTVTEMMLGAGEPNPTTEVTKKDGDIVFTISPATVDALKHFHKVSMLWSDKIPSGLLIHPGKRLRVMARGKSVLCEYLSDDDFPCELAISHIDRLVVMLDAENGSKVIVRKDEALDGALIIDGNRFPLANKEFLTDPTKELLRPERPTASFLLTAGKIKKIIRDARTLEISTVCFLNDNDNNIISVIVDPRILNDSFRVTDVICASPTTVDFCVCLDVDFFKLLPDSDYIVSFANRFIACCFDSVDSRYTYRFARRRGEPDKWSVLNSEEHREPTYDNNDDDDEDEDEVEDEVEDEA